MLLLIGAAAWIYWAASRTPSWYEQAVVPQKPSVQKPKSEQMEQRAAELISGFETTGHWEVLITEEQVNGWLAYGLPEKHPDALPEGFAQPRIKIEPDGITGACRVERGAVAGVISIKVDVYLPEPNVVALRIRRARLGRLPWPLGKILESISQSARDSEVPLTWHQTDGDPVALIHVPLIKGDKRARIEKLQLDKGKIYIAGTTEKVEP